MKGLIYITENIITHKKYIGKSTRTLEDRKLQHLKAVNSGSTLLLHRAIRKYGNESFRWTVLHDNIDESELNTIESACITQYNTIYPHGYNMTFGGEGGDTYTNNPNLPKIREKLKQIQGTPQMRHKKSEWAKTHREHYKSGYHLSEETIQKISQYQKGRKKSEAFKKMVSKTHKGKVLSDETKRKISETKKINGPSKKRLDSYVLTIDNVKMIRQRVTELPSNMKKYKFYEQLAEEYGVSASVIRKIVYKILWKNV